LIGERRALGAGGCELRVEGCQREQDKRDEFESGFHKVSKMFLIPNEKSLRLFQNNCN
jgi:hypothetical protein